MWYLKDILVLPDVKLLKEKAEASKKDAAKEKKEKKGIRGFFNKLFKKKDKSKLDQDSTQNLKNEDADYGYDDFEGKQKDTTNVVQPTEQVKPEPKKKGLFRKKDKEPAKKETDPAKKEDEKDDGF